jgi:hypothetical protein
MRVPRVNAPAGGEMLKPGWTAKTSAYMLHQRDKPARANYKVSIMTIKDL